MNIFINLPLSFWEKIILFSFWYDKNYIYDLWLFLYYIYDCSYNKWKYDYEIQYSLLNYSKL